MKFKELYPLLDKSKVIELYDEYTEDIIGVYNDESKDRLSDMENMEVTAVHTKVHFIDPEGGQEELDSIKLKYCIYLSSICNKLAMSMILRIQDIEKRHEDIHQNIFIDLQVFRKNTKNIFKRSYSYLMDFKNDLYDMNSDLNKAIRKFEDSDFIYTFNCIDKTDLIEGMSVRSYSLIYII